MITTLIAALVIFLNVGVIYAAYEYRRERVCLEELIAAIRAVEDEIDRMKAHEHELTLLQSEARTAEIAP